MADKHTELRYAWAAGVIDGEGCIYIARHKAGGSNGAKADCYTVAIKVTMGHEGTVLALRALFGSGSKHKVEQVGWNPAYTWLVQARLALDVLERIKPYSITKGNEIEVALQFLRLPGWYGGKNRGVKSQDYQQAEYDLWDKMRRLKPRTAYRLARLESASQSS